MARLIVVFALVAGLMAAAFASAANLTVQGGAVQAGADTNLTCDTDGVQVDSWQLFDAANGANAGKVGTVTIKGVSSACAGNRLMGSVKTTNGTYLLKAFSGTPGAYDWATIQNNDSFIYTMGLYAGLNDAAVTYVNMADITGINLYIEGPCGLQP